MVQDRDETRRAIRVAAASIISRSSGFARIRAAGTSPIGFDRAVWRHMCSLGWPGLTIAEIDGGAGLGTSALCALAEELGAALAPEPVIPAAMAARLLPAHRLTDVLSSERIVLPAWQEQPDSLDAIGHATLTGGRISGRKMLVPMALGADAFVVTLPDGAALVERDASRLSLEVADTGDGLHVASLVLDGAPAEAIPGDTAAALDEAILATAAYLLGLVDRAVAITRDAFASRPQLTRHTQAVQAWRQQRMADMEVQLALTRSVVHSAAATLDGVPHAGLRGSAASKAWLRAVDAATVVTRSCVQLVSVQALPAAADLMLFQRRAIATGALYGSATAHRARCPIAPA